jgi:hypothetical protein
MSTQALQNQTVNDRISKEVRKAKVAKLFQTAIKYGVIRPGWSCIDYMFYAAKHHGWESTCISGVKGTLKSNLLLQHGNAIYKNMNETKAHFVTQRKQLLNLMEHAIENEISIPWIGVDDIGALFPKSLYFTHRKMYSKLQASWETVRTVMNNFEFSCVIKRKVAGFILEDITGDIKCYNPIFLDHTDGTSECVKSHYDYRRWLWMRNLKDPTTDIAKIISVEDIPFPATPEALQYDPQLKEGTFHCGGKTYIGADFFKNHACLTGITTKDFKDYWNERLGLAKRSFHDFASILENAEPKHKRKDEQQPITPEMQTEASKAGAALAAKRWH